MDLGLPSGTLWLDRMVGAQSPHEIGLFYQWGAIVGHAESDGYDFSEETYEAEGLNHITSDLNDSQDAARAFYGPSAKMPTQEQLLELVNYTSMQRVGSQFFLTSNVNGEMLIFNTAGYFNGLSKEGSGRLYSWLRNILANAITVYGNLHPEVASLPRYFGLNIMAVHS